MKIPTTEVRKQIERAMTVLMFKAPLYTKFVLMTKLVENPQFPAVMGIRPEHSCLVISYNPNYISESELTPKDLVEVLKHEYGHIILHHVWTPLPNPVLHNIAADLEINQHPWVNLNESPFIKHCGCTPETFNVPIGKSREFYYEQLMHKQQGGGKSSQKQTETQSPNSGQTGPKTPTTQSGKSQETPSGASANAPVSANESISQEQTGQKTPAQQRGQSPETPSAVDSHAHWASSESMSSEVVWRQIVSSALEEAKQRGTLPGDLVETIMAKWKPVPQVGNIIRRLMARHILANEQTAPNRLRPNRRFKLFPGERLFYTPRIVWAVDTSGSMRTAELQIAFGALKWLLREYPVSVIQCDAEITAVAKDIHKINTKINVRGRGGTSFVPVFEYIKKTWKNQIDILVYVTDLFGEFPKDPPPYKVLWLTTLSPKDIKAPFGMTIKLEVPK